MKEYLIEFLLKEYEWYTKTGYNVIYYIWLSYFSQNVIFITKVYIILSAFFSRCYEMCTSYEPWVDWHIGNYTYFSTKRHILRFLLRFTFITGVFRLFGGIDDYTWDLSFFRGCILVVHNFFAIQLIYIVGKYYVYYFILLFFYDIAFTYAEMYIEASKNVDSLQFDILDYKKWKTRTNDRFKYKLEKEKRASYRIRRYMDRSSDLYWEIVVPNTHDYDAWYQEYGKSNDLKVKFIPKIIEPVTKPRPFKMNKKDFKKKYDLKYWKELREFSIEWQSKNFDIEI